jgi:chromate transporter
METAPTMAIPADAAVHAEAPNPTLGALFAGFFSIGISGFGGVLPWARRMIVEQRHWLEPGDFTDVLSLCQFLPGPNIVNVSICVGSRFRGVTGAIAAFAGLMAAPMVIVMALGALYARYGDAPAVRHAFGGIASAAAGLVLSMAFKMAWPLRRQAMALGFVAIVFVAIAVLRLPLIYVLLGLSPVSIATAWFVPRHMGAVTKVGSKGPAK